MAILQRCWRGCHGGGETETDKQVHGESFHVRIIEGFMHGRQHAVIETVIAPSLKFDFQLV